MDCTVCTGRPVSYTHLDVYKRQAHNVSKVKELAPEENVNYMFFNGDGNFPVKVGTRAGHKLGEIYATSL